MSPSLVKSRASDIEYYLKEMCKNQTILRIPFVREFLKLPMNAEEVKDLEEEYVATSTLLCNIGRYFLALLYVAFLCMMRLGFGARFASNEVCV